MHIPQPSDYEAAFSAGAGFGSTNIQFFIRGLIALLATAWAMLLISSWLGQMKTQETPFEFLIIRVSFLALFYVLLGVVLAYH